MPKCRKMPGNIIRNGKSRRCILTSGAAYCKPENIMPRDLQFGWLAESPRFLAPFCLHDEQSITVNETQTPARNTPWPRGEAENS
jgi:hypothetical protein